MTTSSKHRTVTRVTNEAKPFNLHVLKAWPEFFRAVQRGDKKFECRQNDRNFQVGDHILLREFFPESKTYTGQYLLMTITYIMQGGKFGLNEDHVVLSLATPSAPTMVEFGERASQNGWLR